MGAIVINGVDVSEEGGLTVNYGRFPRDVRKNGLMWSHTVHVPAGSDYDDEIEAVIEAFNALMADVLEDEDLAEEVDIEIPEQEEEDDDE